MAKNRDDYSESELRKFHDELSKAENAEERAAIYERIGASGQAVGQWFRRMNLPPLGGGSAKASAPKKRGRPAGSTNKRGPGRPKGSTSKGAAKGKGSAKGAAKGKGSGVKAKAAKGQGRGRKASGGGLGLSREAKETVIRLLSQLLED